MNNLRRITLNDGGGIDFIDLELPSGLLWGKCNLMAKKSYEYGYYFRWGDPNGRAYGNNSTWSGINYSNTPAGQLGAYQNIPVDETYDAARKILGYPWRMPTKQEWNELINNTTNVVINNYKETGIKVCVAISKINGNEIIFPYNGRFWTDTNMNDVGSSVFLWSSSYASTNQNTTYATKIGASSSGLTGPSEWARKYWFGIRAVSSIRI